MFGSNSNISAQEIGLVYVRPTVMEFAFATLASTMFFFAAPMRKF